MTQFVADRMTASVSDTLVFGTTVLDRPWWLSLSPIGRTCDFKLGYLGCTGSPGPPDVAIGREGGNENGAGDESGAG
jgi:hypothetical protein